MDETLLTFAREELLTKIGESEERVWLVSPFLTAPIAARISDAAGRSSAGDLRLLTALVPRSVRAGVLSPAGLSILLNAEFKIASIPNLHAKVSLIDSSWGLVGSGNLTGTGLGGEEGGNVELGVVLSQAQIDASLQLVARWWEEEAKPVASELIAKFGALPPFPKIESEPAAIGTALPLAGVEGLERALAEDEATADNRRYWIKSNYHRSDDEQWWHRNWISDWRQGPYEAGDLIVLYLSARADGPACCPAVVEVTKPSRKNSKWVREHRDPDAAERWPYVTEISVVGEVAINNGAPLAAIEKTGQSVQGGYCRIDRNEFEVMVRAMLAANP